MFARYAIRSGNLKTTISSIDPNPRADINKLCDHVFRANMEQFDPKLFQELEAGDILFFDGSHRIFSNTDVTVFFLEVLPRLKPGVLVHIHDIFLPAIPSDLGRASLQRAISPGGHAAVWITAVSRGVAELFRFH
jgi:hypothetical protein